MLINISKTTDITHAYITWYLVLDGVSMSILLGGVSRDSRVFRWSILLGGVSLDSRVWSLGLVYVFPL